MTYTREKTEDLIRVLRALPALEASKQKLTKQAVVKHLAAEIAALQQRGYRHYHRFKVWFRDIEGDRKSLTFATEDEADTWIAESQRLLVKDGRPIDDVVTAYLDSLTDRKPSTLVTLRYRLASVISGRKRVPIQAFPWNVAWSEHVAKQSRASQVGILAALRGLVAYAGLRGCSARRARREGHQERGEGPAPH
jgi:hypothetical protein